MELACVRNPFDPSDLYDRYPVVIRFRGELRGGVPRNKDMIAVWVQATTGFKDEKAEELTEEAKAALLDGVSEKLWTGFYRDEKHGLYVESRQIKAMIKQSASLLGLTKAKRGSKQILAEGTEVRGLDGGLRVYLGRDEPDGLFEGPIHVMTAQGPRTALKRVDYVTGATLRFEVWILKTAPQEKRHIGPDDLLRIFKHAQENGLGAERSQTFGKFDVLKLGDLEAPDYSPPVDSVPA